MSLFIDSVTVREAKKTNQLLTQLLLEIRKLNWLVANQQTGVQHATERK